MLEVDEAIFKVSIERLSSNSVDDSQRDAKVNNYLNFPTYVPGQMNYGITYTSFTSPRTIR